MKKLALKLYTNVTLIYELHPIITYTTLYKAG